MERLGRLRTAQQHLDWLSRLFETWSRELLADKNGAIAAAERSEQLAREVMANPRSIREAITKHRQATL
jgi:hypothetical protein